MSIHDGTWLMSMPLSEPMSGSHRDIFLPQSPPCFAVYRLWRLAPSSSSSQCSHVCSQGEEGGQAASPAALRDYVYVESQTNTLDSSNIALAFNDTHSSRLIVFETAVKWIQWINPPRSRRRRDSPMDRLLLPKSLKCPVRNSHDIPFEVWPTVI